MTKCIVAMAAATLLAWGQAEIHGLAGKGNINFSGATRSTPCRTGTGAPTAINGTVGDCYFQTDATAGNNMWLATVTGTPATWSQITGSGGGGGGGGGNPFTMTVNTTADTVTLTATRAVNFLRGSELTTVNSGETFTWDTPTGSGDYIIYYNGGMVLSSLALTGVGTATTSSRGVSAAANASTGLTLPQGAIPLYAGTVTSDNFVNTSVNQYSSDSSPYVIAAGSNVTLTATNAYTLSVASTGGGGGGGTTCEILKSGVGATTSSLTETNLASVTLPALTVGETLRFGGIFLHATPTNAPVFRMNFGSTDVVNYSWAAAGRTWLQFAGDIHYTGTTESYIIPVGRDSSGNVVSIGITGTAATTDLSTGTAVLNIAGHLSGGPAGGESVALASYYVERCPNVP